MTALERIRSKLARYESEGLLRTLAPSEVGSKLIDFTSNDYLGVVRDNLLTEREGNYPSGATGSRLLSGNHEIFGEAERAIAQFHKSESALIFNSGYDANLGVLSAIPQKGDTILYDEYCHASMRDGIRLSFANSYSFLHNDLTSLSKKLKFAKGNIYIAVESVYSMDGDIAPLRDLVELAKQHGAALIVDEAHATGVFGDHGAGILQSEDLQDGVFIRIYTFGKGLGCHGAVAVGPEELKSYLTNFARSFIYTTALSPDAIAKIKRAYEIVPTLEPRRQKLQELIAFFKGEDFGARIQRGESDSQIQTLIVPGNNEIRSLTAALRNGGVGVRGILSPTVPRGQERVRVCLHSFNSVEEIALLASLSRAWNG